MPDFTEMLQSRLAGRADTQQKEAAIPPSFDAHKFKSKKKDKDDDSEGDESAEHEKKEEKGEGNEYPEAFDKKTAEQRALEKKAAQQEISTFADTVNRLTEKTASIVREDHGAAAEQLYRNMVSSSMNFKLAGVTHEAFETPEVLVKNSYQLMLKAAELLDVKLV